VPRPGAPHSPGWHPPSGPRVCPRPLPRSKDSRTDGLRALISALKEQQRAEAQPAEVLPQGTGPRPRQQPQAQAQVQRAAAGSEVGAADHLALKGQYNVHPQTQMQPRGAGTGTGTADSHRHRHTHRQRGSWAPTSKLRARPCWGPDDRCLRSTVRKVPSSGQAPRALSLGVPRMSLQGTGAGQGSCGEWWCQ